MTSLNLIPLEHNSKVCKVKRWEVIDWKNPEIKKQYASRYKNVGWIVPLNMMVLDVDTKGDKVGAQSLADLEAKYGKLPECPTQRTASGGLHLVFKLPQDIVLHNSTSKVGKDLDVRSEGKGYIVVQPSTIDGGKYEWIKYSPNDTENWNPPLAPQWLIELAQAEKKKTPKAGNSKAKQIAPVALKQLDDAEISKIRTVLGNIPKDRIENYQDWLKCGLALSNWSNGGDIGLQLWIELSKRGANFEEGVCEAKYRGFTPSITNGVSVATLFWMGGSLSLNDEGLVARLHSMVGDKLKYSPSLGWLVFKGADYVS